jgi:TubC N-terminal docking domain
MTAAELLDHLARIGVFLAPAKGGSLRVRSAKGSLADDMRAWIRHHRQELLLLLILLR